jgi:hypothetical protein
MPQGLLVRREPLQPLTVLVHGERLRLIALVVTAS